MYLYICVCVWFPETRRTPDLSTTRYLNYPDIILKFCFDLFIAHFKLFLFYFGS